MKKFVSKLPTKKVPFMDDEITISKLSAGAVKRIGQESTKVSEEDDDNVLKVLAVIIAAGVVLEEGEDPITVELLEEFPLDELTKLSNEIMQYAGINSGNDSGNEG